LDAAEPRNAGTT